LPSFALISQTLLWWLFLIHSIRFDLIALTVAMRDGSQFADVRYDDLVAELLPLLAGPDRNTFPPPSRRVPEASGKSNQPISRHLAQGLVANSEVAQGTVFVRSKSFVTVSEYLLACRRALRTLTDGEEFLEARRSDPSGTIKIACPLTMAREILAPLLKDFIARFPSVRMEIEPYSFGWDQEPREDVDVFFKLKAPKDSVRRVRSYPGTAWGLFASPAYVSAFGCPANPDALAVHRCAGSGVWKLSRGSKEVSPNIAFHVVTSHPGINLLFALDGLGITILPLWMAKHLTTGLDLFRFFRCRSRNRSLCVRFSLVRLDSRQSRRAS
jgi:DNA-binding transcriptional LysR family regulator